MLLTKYFSYNYTDDTRNQYSQRDFVQECSQISKFL